MVMANPDWRQPYKNGWVLDLIVIVEGSCVGLARPEKVPGGVTREIDFEVILDHLAKFLGDWLFGEIKEELWTAFCRRVLAQQTPAVLIDSPAGVSAIARMRDSMLFFQHFKSDCLTTIIDGLQTHLAEWAETELEEMVRAQLMEPEANQARYAFRFPPDELDIRVHFPQVARLHPVEDGEPTIEILEGTGFALPHLIQMTKPGELVFRLGDETVLFPEG